MYMMLLRLPEHIKFSSPKSSYAVRFTIPTKFIQFHCKTAGFVSTDFPYLQQRIMEELLL